MARRRYGRDTLLKNDLDHTPAIGVDNLLHGALLNTLLWDQSHNFNDLVHDLRKALNRHLRLAIWTQPPKITILAYISQFLSRSTDIECVSSLACPNIPGHQRQRQDHHCRRLAPPAMSGLCLLMRMALAAIRSASDRHLVRSRRSSCAMPRSWHRAARPNPLDLSAPSAQQKQDTRLRLTPNREHS